MRRLLLLFGCLAAIALAGCSSDSAFPTATGKGTIRAINAIKSSPGISFLIEERQINVVDYKSSSGNNQYDDLDYTFNFEVLFAGDTARTRVASSFLDVVADREYTYLISGTIANPTIMVWEADVREWNDGETVFEARFAHTAAARGAIDLYFAAPGITPALGQEIGSLSFGEILPIADYPQGDYVYTITDAGDPTSVIYTSDTITPVEQTSLLFIVFDADESDLAPVSVRFFNAGGSLASLPDVRFDPTMRFFHASTALGTSDIYLQETLTTPLLVSHAFGDITGDIPVASDAYTITYTAEGNSGSILVEHDVNLLPGTHNHYFVVGEMDAFSVVAVIPDRRSVETIVKFSALNASTNHAAIDLYIVTADTSITESVPLFFSLALGSGPLAANLQAGSFDVYLTTATEETILAGPIRIDTTVGDVLSVIAMDNVDPAIADLVFVPDP